MMDVVIGNCVLCTHKTVVLNTKSNKRFLDLLQTHFFEENNEHFTQFLELFNSKDEVNSFCMSCAYKLNCYVETRNTCNESIKTRSGRTCSLCNNADCVTKSSDELNEHFAFILKGFKKQPRIKLVCLRCWFSVSAFKEIKEFLSQILNPNEDSNDSDSSKDVVAMEILDKKRKNNESEGQNVSSKRFKKTSNVVESAKQPKNSSTRSSTKEVDKQLKHLNTVNVETLDRDMHLSYLVVTDQKLMFDIPFVDCNATEKKPAKMVAGRGRRSAAKQTKPPLYPEVIDISSDNESDTSSVSRLRTKRNIPAKKEAAPLPLRSTRSTRKERSVPVPVSKPTFKTPKVPKKPMKVAKPVYQCTKCTKILKMKYTWMLHELEHDGSFSPMIRLERSELLALKATLTSNDDIHIDADASPVIDTDKTTEDDGVLKNTETENPDGLEVEISNDTDEKEEKDASKPDEDDVPTDIEKDTSEQQVDVSTEIETVSDATDIIDIASEKDEDEDATLVESPEKTDDAKESPEDDENAIINEKNPPPAEDDVSVVQEKDAAPENTEDTTTKEDEVQLEKDAEKTEDISASPKKSDKLESPKTLDKVESPQKSDNIESPKKSDNVESPKKSDKVESPENSDKVESPKKSDEVESLETQKTIEDKLNEDTPKKQVIETIVIDESPEQNEDDIIEGNTDKESPKKQQDTEDKFDELKNSDNKKIEETKDKSDSEETNKKIEKKMEDNLSPISSDNESNTEANDNNTQNSDVSDNDNASKRSKQQAQDSNDKKTNGVSDYEFDEFTLKLSSSEESNSPDKKNTSNQENESANSILGEQTANTVCKTTEQQDTFQIVENLLQNLGA